MKISSFLPVFNGFYNTIWSYDNNIINYINDNRRDENLKDINFDHLDIDYKNYEIKLSKKLCEVIKNKLSDFVENIIYENIYSPKEYNFSTDSINCIIIPKIDNIKKFIYEHKEDYIIYLKERYTSCDGFISHYSNDFDTWEFDTNNFTKLDIDSHCLGSILQFISEFLEIDNLSIFYAMEIDYFNYINNIDQLDNTPICSNCEKFIENEKILNDLKKYNENIGKNPSLIYCNECMHNNY